jgi:hypothetical protein
MKAMISPSVWEDITNGAPAAVETSRRSSARSRRRWTAAEAEAEAEAEGEAVADRPAGDGV